MGYVTRRVPSTAEWSRRAYSLLKFLSQRRAAHSKRWADAPSGGTMERLPTPHRILPIGFATILIVGTAAAQVPPLVIAKQGYFFVGGKYLETQDGRFMSGQMYV